MSVDRDVKVPAGCPRDHHVAQPGCGAVHPARPRLHQRAGDARRGEHRRWLTPRCRWNGTRSKQSLTDLAKQLSPAAGQLQGPLGKAINQAADTFNGNGDSFRSALRELSQAAGRLGDSRTDIFGTVKNLQVLVDALSASNEQIVAFSGHVASVSQVLAKSSTHLDQHPRHAEPGAGRRQRLSAAEQLDADRNSQQAQRPDPGAERSERRHRAGAARRRPRHRQLLQHLRPRAGHLERADLDPGVRQPGAVHLRRILRHRGRVCPARSTTSVPRSAASGWARRCAG